MQGFAAEWILQYVNFTTIAELLVNGIDADPYTHFYLRALTLLTTLKLYQH